MLSSDRDVYLCANAYDFSTSASSSSASPSYTQYRISVYICVRAKSAKQTQKHSFFCLLKPLTTREEVVGSMKKKTLVENHSKQHCICMCIVLLEMKLWTASDPLWGCCCNCCCRHLSVSVFLLLVYRCVCVLCLFRISSFSPSPSSAVLVSFLICCCLSFIISLESNESLELKARTDFCIRLQYTEIP